MSTVKGVLNDLVRRRLWPFAVLFIALAIAAPVVLSKESEPVAAVPAAAAATVEGQPIASVVDDFSADARRRVLGATKDPFTPTGRQPQASSTEPEDPGTGAPVTDGSTAAPTDGSASPPSAGGAGATGGSPAPEAPTGITPVTPTSPAPTTPQPGTDGETYDLYSLKVRFDEGEPTELERLKGLPPESETPTVIYLGLLEDAKTAVFLLDERVTTEGDGTCRPSPADCQRVHLKKGETQFFDLPATDAEGAEGEAVSEQHQLEIVSITTRKTASASKARSAYTRSSKAGRRALRSRTARAGRLRYDARTGLLRRISLKAHRASLARTRSARLAPPSGSALPDLRGLALSATSRAMSH